LTVQQASLAAEIARREIDKQRYANRPTLDLVGNLGHSRSSSAQFIGVSVNAASVGVQFAMPLYAGGAIDARVREAIALQAKSQSDLENARRQADQAARAYFLGLSSGLAQVNALKAAEKSSQLALDSNQLGYQVGVRINIDVLNAQQQLYTTRRDLAKARYEVLLNGLRLKASVGELAEKDLARAGALMQAASNR
ncbi:MAG: TolC family protein, partial [Quisquiliibacterium sp.]